MIITVLKGLKNQKGLPNYAAKTLSLMIIVMSLNLTFFWWTNSNQIIMHIIFL